MAATNHPVNDTMFAGAEEKELSEAKRIAAHAAIGLLEMAMELEDAPDPFHLGLGSGSTAEHFIRKLDELPPGLFGKLRCVPTSESTRRVAEEMGVTLADLNDLVHLHLTVDGADEIDPDLNLIKGGGGALLFEKIVADRSDFFIIIVDESKAVEALGKFPLPVEVVQYGAQSTAMEILQALKQMGMEGKQLQVRGHDQPFITDSGNLIFDVELGRVENVAELSLVLSQIPGVVEHGLFHNIVSVAVVGSNDGSISVMGPDLETTDYTHDDFGPSKGQGGGNGSGNGSGIPGSIN